MTNLHILYLWFTRNFYIFFSQRFGSTMNYDTDTDTDYAVIANFNFSRLLYRIAKKNNWYKKYIKEIVDIRLHINCLFLRPQKYKRVYVKISNHQNWDLTTLQRSECGQPAWPSTSIPLCQVSRWVLGILTDFELRANFIRYARSKAMSKN